MQSSHRVEQHEGVTFKTFLGAFYSGCLRIKYYPRRQYLIVTLIAFLIK
jgi:hypothetical protein